MLSLLRVTAAVLLIGAYLHPKLCPAQDIRFVSEFQRVDPYGNVLLVDREMRPREVLSPAVPRNGHLSLHVVVTAPANTNYFLYAESNPPGLVRTQLYREHWRRCGERDCGDWLSPINSPAFGAIPESLTAHRRQTTRNYLLDVYVPADVPPRRIRIEALLKVGYWLVAPIELRVIEPVVPLPNGLPMESIIAPVDRPAAETAQLQLLRASCGLPPAFPPAITCVRDVIQRNAAEDMLLAASGRIQGSPRLSELMFFSFYPFTYPENGSEWYLRVRDFFHRLF